MSPLAFRLLITGATALLLAACSDTTEAPPSANDAAEVKTPVEPTPPPAYVGTWAFDPAWCTDQTNGFPVTISETRFEGRENICEMNNVTITPEGGWTADLTCTAEGTTNEERLAMTPIGEQLALTWLDRPEPEATLFTRCP